MVFMKWSDELGVNVKEIDEQHKKLFEIINRAHEGAINKDKKEGNDVLNELIEFVRVHFSTEEKYFEKCNYSGAKEHIAEHLKLTEKVLKFKNDFDKGECDCSAFLDFLKSWIEEHLKVMDMKYVSEFKKCGLR
ncbi:hemerythrin family protein [archaeon]|jgi:hemerythrin-like metal-binding protein|nr:hemerythrin family protein [archaeon]